MKTILKGLVIINPEQNLNQQSDIMIEDGVIVEIGEINEKEHKDVEVLSMEGLICAPGFFDMHVHLREPGREDEETVVSGANSAAAGGFTGVACMPNTNPAIDSAEVISLIKRKAENHLVDVIPIGAVSLNREGVALAPISEMYEAGALGFSDDGTAVKTASLLRSALEYTQMFDAPVIEHCEDESLAGGSMNESLVCTELGLPPLSTVAEDLIVMRGILLAEYTGGKIHIAHISSKRSVELVREAKARGVKVTAEVTPHHFSLTDDLLKGFDTNYKMNPPLRSRTDVEEIISGLSDGTIDCIATDHAPHSIEEKEMEFIYAPNGIIGLETAIGLAISELVQKGKLTIEQLVEKFAINPRKVLNIEVPKIAKGEKANMTILDPQKIWTVDIEQFKSKSKNSPFDKRLLTGKAIASINNSRLFYKNEFREI